MLTRAPRRPAIPGAKRPKNSDSASRCACSASANVLEVHELRPPLALFRDVQLSTISDDVDFISKSGDAVTLTAFDDQRVIHRRTRLVPLAGPGPQHLAQREREIRVVGVLELEPAEHDGLLLDLGVQLGDLPRNDVERLLRARTSSVFVRSSGVMRTRSSPGRASRSNAATSPARADSSGIRMIRPDSSARTRSSSDSSVSTRACSSSGALMIKALMLGCGVTIT